MGSKCPPLHVPLTNNESFVIIAAVQCCVLDTSWQEKRANLLIFCANQVVSGNFRCLVTRNLCWTLLQRFGERVVRPKRGFSNIRG